MPKWMMVWMLVVLFSAANLALQPTRLYAQPTLEEMLDDELSDVESEAYYEDIDVAYGDIMKDLQAGKDISYADLQRMMGGAKVEDIVWYELNAEADREAQGGGGAQASHRQAGEAHLVLAQAGRKVYASYGGKAVSHALANRARGN